MNNEFLAMMKDLLKDEFDTFSNNLLKEPVKAFTVNQINNNEINIIETFDFEVEPFMYNKDSFYYKNDGIASLWQHELGLIYGQDPASTIPALVLKQKENSIILDMCAAPGGKSINLYNYALGKSLLISNEIDYKRCSIMLSNFERMGFDNFIITNEDTKNLAKTLKHKVDYCLVDAPCSGEGMIRKNDDVLKDWSLNNIELCHHRQLEILENAYETLKDHAYILYSTCTYNTKENEEVLNEFLAKHDDLNLLPIDSIYHRRGFAGKGIDETYVVRFNINDNTEGQFISLIERKNETIINEEIKLINKKISNKLVDDFIKENTTLDNYYLNEINNKYYLSLNPFYDLKNKILRQGILVGEVDGKVFKPEHHFYRAKVLKNYYKYVYELNDFEYQNYLKGLEIPVSLDNHYYALRYKGYSLGFGKVSNGTLKNKYPKGLRKK